MIMNDLKNVFTFSHLFSSRYADFMCDDIDYHFAMSFTSRLYSV